MKNKIRLIFLMLVISTLFSCGTGRVKNEEGGIGGTGKIEECGQNDKDKCIK